jgi:WD40 repeat protein
VYDGRTGAPLRTLDGRSTVTWAAAGRVTTGAGDGRVIVWDPDTGVRLDEFAAEGQLVEKAAWSPVGARLAAAVNGTVWVWDPALRAERSFPGDPPLPPGHVAWSPDDSRLVGRVGDRVRLWDAETGAETRSRAVPPDTTADWVDRDLLAVHTGGAGTETRRAFLWDLGGDRVAAAFDATGRKVEWSSESADRTRVAVLFRDPAARPELWDLRANAKRALPAPPFPATRIHLSPRGRSVAVSGNHPRVVVYDSAADRWTVTVDRTATGENVSNLGWSPDDRFLFVNTMNRRGVLCVPADGRPVADLNGLVGPPVWPAAADRFLGTKGSTVRLWHLSDDGIGPERAVQPNDNAHQLSAYWLPDGHRAAASYWIGQQDGWRTVVWDAARGTELFTLSGITRSTTARDWSPDGSRVVTRRKNGLRLWDGRTGWELLDVPLDREQDPTWRWSSDGRQILLEEKGGLRVLDGRPVPR